MKTQLVMCALILLTAAPHFAKSSLGICITNCVQCIRMYGEHFDGKMCGDNCLATNGKTIPDCNNPGTLIGLLKQIYLKNNIS